MPLLKPLSFQIRKIISNKRPPPNKSPPSQYLEIENPKFQSEFTKNSKMCVHNQRLKREK